jgi:hypothetical protein
MTNPPDENREHADELVGGLVAYQERDPHSKAAIQNGFFF